MHFSTVSSVANLIRSELMLKQSPVERAATSTGSSTKKCYFLLCIPTTDKVNRRESCT